MGIRKQRRKTKQHGEKRRAALQRSHSRRRISNQARETRTQHHRPPSKSRAQRKTTHAKDKTTMGKTLPTKEKNAPTTTKAPPTDMPIQISILPPCYSSPQTDAHRVKTTKQINVVFLREQGGKGSTRAEPRLICK